VFAVLALVVRLWMLAESAEFRLSAISVEDLYR
jgi:hypothetical protein